MGHETGQHQNIEAAGAVGLEREMDAAAADVARRRRVRDRRRCAGVHQRAGLGFGRHVELVAKTLRQGLEVALGGGPISGEQEIADEMPAVHFAERIERDETAGVRGRGRVVAGRIPVVHHALERLDRPAPQGLAAKEGPLVELRAVARREALEEVAPIEAAGQLELAAVAGLLEQLKSTCRSTADDHRTVDRSVVRTSPSVSWRRCNRRRSRARTTSSGLSGHNMVATTSRPTGPFASPDRSAGPGLCARPAGTAGRPDGSPEIRASAR